MVGGEFLVESGGRGGSSAEEYCSLDKLSRLARVSLGGERQVEGCTASRVTRLGRRSECSRPRTLRTSTDMVSTSTLIPVYLQADSFPLT